MASSFSFIAYDHESFELFNTDLSLWEIFFSKKSSFFPKFSIFETKFLETYITNFQTETSFELGRGRAFE